MSSSSAKRAQRRTERDLSGIGLALDSIGTASGTGYTYLPDLRSIAKPEDRKKWYGFLKYITSVNQLIGRPGLYPWYKRKSLAMQNSLKRHIRDNLPEGSHERFSRALLLASKAYEMKFKQAIHDEDFILAELKKLDETTSVVVRIPKEDFASILNLYALQGYTNKEIAKVLGISLDTVEKVNAGLTRVDLVKDFKFRAKEVLHSRHLRALLRKTEVDEVSISDHLRVLRYCEEQLNKAQESGEKLSDDDAETQKILGRHRRLIEQYGLDGQKETQDADTFDEQNGEAGGTEGGSPPGSKVRDLGTGGAELPDDREPEETDG